MNLAMCMDKYVTASISEMIGQIISGVHVRAMTKCFSEINKWQREGCFQWKKEAKSWLVSMETVAAAGRTAVEEKGRS